MSAPRFALSSCSKKDTKIKTQLPPLTLSNPLMAASALEYWLSGPAISRQHHKALIQSQGIATSPGSSDAWPTWSSQNHPRPPDRDWTMQIPYAEMGIQRGWTGNVRMWGWTDHETPAGLPHPATTVYSWGHWRVQPRARSFAPALGGSRVVKKKWRPPFAGVNYNGRFDYVLSFGMAISGLFWVSKYNSISRANSTHPPHPNFFLETHHWHI